MAVNLDHLADILPGRWVVYTESGHYVGEIEFTDPPRFSGIKGLAFYWMVANGLEEARRCFLGHPMVGVRVPAITLRITKTLKHGKNVSKPPLTWRPTRINTHNEIELSAKDLVGVEKQFIWQRVS